MSKDFCLQSNLITSHIRPPYIIVKQLLEKTWTKLPPWRQRWVRSCCCVETVTSHTWSASLSHHCDQSLDEPLHLSPVMAADKLESFCPPDSYTPNAGWLKYPCLSWLNYASTRRLQLHLCVWAGGQSFLGDSVKLWCRASSVHFLWMLSFWLEWCAFRTSLAAIYLQKYWAFSKNTQSYPSALQLLGFDSNFSLSMQEAETTSQFACAVLEEKALVCSFSSLS